MEAFNGRRGRHLARSLPLVFIALLLSVFVLPSASASSSQGSGGGGESCQLSKEWHGSWFQSGLSTVTINATAIDVKGKCLDSDGDYFLFGDEVEDCYRCLFIVSKHANVIQYKESNCEERDSLEKLCQLIPGDAQQYSLFRRDAAPVECPFRGSYTFTYSRGHGECRSPVSRLDSCTESWRTFFRYQACPDVQGTESSEEQLECLANWKEGSLRYMMGRVQHQSATSDEDRYRCFAYEKVQVSSVQHGTGGSPTDRQHRSPMILLAQSGDATCSGLTSPTEGSRTLKLTKVEADGRRCRYPSWLLAHNHWQTLDGRWTYNLHKNQTLRIVNVSSSPGSSADPRHEQKAVCHSVIDMAEGNAARVVAHVSHGCQTGYVCMVFYQRSSHVVEFQAGDSAPSSDEACSPYYFNPVPGHYTTLIAPSHQAVTCPLEGKFNVLGLPCSSGAGFSNSAEALSSSFPMAGTASQLQQSQMAATFAAFGIHRTSTVAVGCSAPDTLDLFRECSRETSTGYLCRSTWIDDDEERPSKLVVVTRLHASPDGGRHEPRRLCVTMSINKGQLSGNKPGVTGSPPQQVAAATTAAASNTFEWIVSSETCVRPYAKDRLATHGQHSTHLSHNAHNLHINPATDFDSTVVVLNVTSSGQCTGVEAAILDQRKLFRSSSSASSASSKDSLSYLYFTPATIVAINVILVKQLLAGQR